MVDIKNKSNLENYLLSITDKDKQRELARAIAYRLDFCPHMSYINTSQ